MHLLIPLALVLAGGCFDKDGGQDDDDGGGDGGSGDAGGSDSGDPQLDCDDGPAPAAIQGPDCVTATLSCGQTILGTTEGGTDVMDGDAYQSWYCAVVGPSEYAGAERVYAFQHPGGGNATVYLSSPCDDLDLFAIHWEDDDICPIADYSIQECEGDIGSGSHSFVIWNDTPRRYLVVVEGPQGEEAPFELSVVCP